MRKHKGTHADRFWLTKHAPFATYAAESLEWREGSFWLVHSDRPAGEMLWREEIGLWQELPTQGDTGRLLHGRLSVAEGLKWLLIQGYDLDEEPEEFIEEVLAQLGGNRRVNV
jgi:hypothetical protein